MIQRGWSDLHKRQARLRPPLSPGPQTVAIVEGLLAHIDGPRLLLGVTPALAGLQGRVIAVDWNAEMIAAVWPGNRHEKQAIRADWSDMPFAPASFGAAAGDGSLNMLRWPEDYAVIRLRLADVVRPGGRIAIRCFVAPDRPETTADLANAILNGERCGFHAFKWRLAMAAMESGANISARAIWEAFERLFPNRERLSRATGWNLETIAEIDDYAVSPLSKSFPTRAQLIETFPGVRFVGSGDYELAERCPLLVADL